MKVIKNKILVEPIEEKDKSTGKFVISNDGAVLSDRGVVVDVGEDVKNVKSGDSIIFASYARSEFDLDGKKYFVVSEEDIIVILNNK